MSDPSERIISHMNADHQLALTDYAVVYAGAELGLFKEQSVKLTKVTEKSFTIEYETNADVNKQFTLDWDDASEPEKLKVNSLRDVKDKLISMAKYAAAKQGYSYKKITKVTPPDNVGSYSMYVFIPILVTNVINPDLIPSYLGNDFIYNLFISYIPEFVSQNQPFLLFTIAFIHLMEILFFTIPTLNKYRVPIKQCIPWVLMNAMEGFFVIFRLRDLMKD